jgi:regulator of protease activity HflC (stomatin/prohibitin superfamily)
MTPEEEKKQIISWIKRGILGLLALIVLWGSWTMVPAGKRGVVLRFTAVDRVINEGINWKIPIIESVKKMDVRIQKEEVSASSASKDLQIVSAVIALNYHLENEAVGSLWKNIGSDYKIRVIDPAIQESVKASTAKYTAEELITKRPLVKDDIKISLTERLAKEFIIVDDLSIVDFDFSESFNQAIESKVTAEQNALAAKNKLEQVKFEASQRIAQATAEAEAIRIQAQAITQQGGKEYVNLKWVEAWRDGGAKVPEFIIGDGGSSFIFNMNK